MKSEHSVAYDPFLVIKVEILDAWLPGEEPHLGTSICRFSGVDLSLDYHSPEATHSAHAAAVRHPAEEAFEKHLLPLDVPCTYHSQGPTKKQNPKLCGWTRSKTRQEQAGHVFGHTLTHHKLHHAVGRIPHGVWHCYYDGCAFITTSPSINTKHSKVHLSTTSIFSLEQTYLRHLYQEHSLSPIGAESVLWCGICEQFLEWIQFGPGKDENFNIH
ncbi:hypothetical protein NA56DRAFT_696366 [Hyaloscypha hepaticicola]|uniref:Uncharacterized protein n=1 Tax=Hyaloscypha hepaticicola TaxID=2082293 RepID=A0A2J6QQP0_9HELO|nr:hypothetical protein NA56DRAFT_696366 [Hyaloscypha hepaticicola]